MAAARNQVEYIQEVPIFLRKTFEMVTTCDPAIAGWSEDGETFVVKDPKAFEQTIIPSFFKHSKFTSFVRQLNFYSFRKIKYNDSLRIDPKIEAQTSNYWRFRHESFRKDRPDLLQYIKRMNGQPKSATAASTATGNAAVSSTTAVSSTRPVVVASSAVASKAVNSEVQALKKRIDEMNKNIDELTAMVNKVNIKQEEQEKAQEVDSAGAKRKKYDPLSMPMPELSMSGPEPLDETDIISGARPDEVGSSMDMDEFPAAPVPLPDPMSMVASRETSDSTTISDNEFVERLFHVFEDDELEAVLNQEPPAVAETSNHPDSELMQRLGDALALLPKETQEMIVERLIKAIISPDFADNFAASQSAAKVVPAGKAVLNTVPVSTEDEPQQQQQQKQQQQQQQQSQVTLPLAAATLAALLHHYTTQVQEETEAGKKSKNLSTKTLPVIPVHA